LRLLVQAVVLSKILIYILDTNASGLRINLNISSALKLFVKKLVKSKVIPVLVIHLGLRDNSVTYASVERLKIPFVGRFVIKTAD